MALVTAPALSTHITHSIDLPHHHGSPLPSNRTSSPTTPLVEAREDDGDEDTDEGKEEEEEGLGNGGDEGDDGESLFYELKEASERKPITKAIEGEP